MRVVPDGGYRGSCAGSSIERGACSEMFAAARQFGLSITFHRAIDRSRDIFKAFEMMVISVQTAYSHPAVQNLPLKGVRLLPVW